MRARIANVGRLGAVACFGLAQAVGGCSDEGTGGNGGGEPALGDGGTDGPGERPCPSSLWPDRCGSSCVNQQTDVRHCGTCGNECPAGGICAQGECACPPLAPDRCGSSCVDLATDPSHCGACSEECSGICGAGKCNRATELSLGGQHTVVLMSDGSVTGFGYNGFGQLGEGLDSTVLAPARLAISERVSTVSAGRSHTCVLVAGKVLCFGDNAFGQLGEETKATSLVPVEIGGVEDATRVAAGGRHGCALTLGGAVRCWGWNSNGQLGDGTTTPLRPVAVPVVELPAVVQVTAGGAHTCARTEEGQVYCWGDNTLGQLGDGTRVRSAKPLMMAGVGVATSVRAGGTQSCALLDGGAVSCWGGAPLVAADAAPVGTLEPRGVEGVEGATAIAVGRAHACAIIAGGAVRCWTPESPESSPVAGVEDAVAVEAGDDHTCALLSDGAVWCWGAGEQGQLGRGAAPGSADDAAPVVW